MRTRLGLGMRMSQRMTALVVGVVGLVFCLVVVVTVVSRSASLVAPAAWAGTVCEALTPWKAEVANLTAAARTEMGKADTPDRARQALVSLLTGAENASEIARSRVAEAGTPDVDGGQAVVRRVETALTKARDAYRHARMRVEDLSVTDATVFYDGVAGAFVTLNQEYEASVLDTTALGPTELRRAFSEVPECR